MARLTGLQLKDVLQRKGYGIASELKSAFGKTSDLEDRGQGKVPDVESCVGFKPVCPQKPPLEYTGRVHVRIRVFRKRLTDPLGDCHKYHIDSARYAGLLKDDTDAEISVTEEPHQKVETEAEERVELELTYENVTWPKL